MISDSFRYYGCVLYQVIEQPDQHATIQRLNCNILNLYLVNDDLPFYIKYSTNRTGPWSSSFQLTHQERQKELFDIYREYITVFVYGHVGIAARLYAELQRVIGVSSRLQEDESIQRRHNKMYQIKGRNGALDRNISRSSFSEILKNHAERLMHK
jgi:hypothetical protein